MANQKGFILIAVLLFVFFVTLLVMQGSDILILMRKAHANAQRSFAVFSRAQLGLQEMVLAMQGQSMQLPQSSIVLTTQKKMISVDLCGNQTWVLTAIAKTADTVVVLNSEDIFAKVPLAPGCKQIPAHQVIWFTVE